MLIEHKSNEIEITLDYIMTVVESCTDDWRFRKGSHIAITYGNMAECTWFIWYDEVLKSFMINKSQTMSEIESDLFAMHKIRINNTGQKLNIIDHDDLRSEILRGIDEIRIARSDLL